MYFCAAIVCRFILPQTAQAFANYVYDKNPLSTQTKENFLGNMIQGPSNQELDVSITGENVIQLAGVTATICIVSIAVPAAYVLRLTPRQILSRKEG